jgi:hypothetical protein
MATSPDEITIWSKVAAGAAGLAATLAGLVWKDAQRRVEKAESGIADLRANKADKSTVETHRQENRETFINVFKKLDDMKDDINEKHNALMQAIYSNGSDRRKTPRG